VRQRTNQCTTACELIDFAALVIIIHIALPFYCARMWLRKRIEKKLPHGKPD
jgi:hypothetical protein